ncbi:hypothetical protein B0H11DRAFT_523979 [Mycena galericulata]|nr:hypothetical protein B0H11DRAFT_523979 [Mycena galericulata]
MHVTNDVATWTARHFFLLTPIFLFLSSFKSSSRATRCPSVRRLGSRTSISAHHRVPSTGPQRLTSVNHPAESSTHHISLEMNIPVPAVLDPFLSEGNLISA